MLISSTKAQEGEDRHDDDDQPNDVNDLIQDYLPAGDSHQRGDHEIVATDLGLFSSRAMSRDSRR
jgi:hypothetical protein